MTRTARHALDWDCTRRAAPHRALATRVYLHARRRASCVVSESPGGTYTEISAAGYSACARTHAGEIDCWGYDEFGEVSDAPAGTFLQLDGGRHHQCAIATDGGLSCWGQDSNGQVSDTP